MLDKVAEFSLNNYFLSQVYVSTTVGIKVYKSEFKFI